MKSGYIKWMIIRRTATKFQLQTYFTNPLKPVSWSILAKHIVAAKENKSTGGWTIVQPPVTYPYLNPGERRPGICFTSYFYGDAPHADVLRSL